MGTVYPFVESMSMHIERRIVTENQSIAASMLPELAYKEGMRTNPVPSNQ